MQMTLKAGITALAGILVAMFAVNANAECGSFQKSHFGASLHQQSWEGTYLSSPASLLSVADSGEPIVGFWKVTFTSEGTPGIPDGTVIDQAYSQWHSDGTEIMNSSRPPVTQSFCLGVWKKVGGLCYKLNHFAISYACSESATALPWDPNNNLVGPGNIREEVALSPTGKKFNGTFKG